ASLLSRAHRSCACARRSLRNTFDIRSMATTDYGAAEVAEVAEPAKEQQEPFVNLEDTAVPLKLWAAFPMMGMLVIFSVPSMTFGLYKQALQSVLELTVEEAGDIASYGLIGGMVLGFVPGLVYDRFGYVVTLVLGGFMSSGGAFLWYYQLCGGQRPSWLGLALALMLTCHGTRFQYFAGICASLGAFPARLSGSMSAAMAVLVSVGYIILPQLWTSFFLPEAGDTSAWNANGTLKTLEPVAHFWRLLSGIYFCTTLAGLSVARLLPHPKKSSVAESLGSKLARGANLEAIVLLLMVAMSLAFTYVFMVNGFGSASSIAQAGAAERGKIIKQMGMIGMLGRMIHGSLADVLKRGPAGKAGTYISYCVGICSATSGFILMRAGMQDITGTLPSVWENASYLIAFGFGGLFALFPASARLLAGHPLLHAGPPQLWLREVGCELPLGRRVLRHRGGVFGDLRHPPLRDGREDLGHGVSGADCLCGTRGRFSRMQKGRARSALSWHVLSVCVPERYWNSLELFIGR
ncbi:unnamed protein product, partial [Effrenium voratum]